MVRDPEGCAPGDSRPAGLRIDARDLPTRAFLALADALALYHRPRVVPLDRLERLFLDGRRVVAVGNHALDIGAAGLPVDILSGLEIDSGSQLSSIPVRAQHRTGGLKGLPADHPRKVRILRT